MRSRLLLYCLTTVLFFSPAFRVFAAEQVGKPKTEPEIQVSVEDQKVIAMMELLEKMDMLNDLELMTLGEVGK